MTYPYGAPSLDNDYLYDNTNFAAYASTTQEQWENSLGSATSAGFSDAEDGFTDVLSDTGTGTTNAQAALDLIDDIAKAIHNGYEGSGGDGTAEQVQAVIEDIVSRLEALEP